MISLAGIETSPPEFTWVQPFAAKATLTAFLIRSIERVSRPHVLPRISLVLGEVRACDPSLSSPVALTACLRTKTSSRSKANMALCNLHLDMSEVPVFLSGQNWCQREEDLSRCKSRRSPEW